MANHIPILAEPGELVIPRQLAGDIIPQLQKALAKTNDDMEKFPGVNGLDFRQFMVGNPEAKTDPETGMEMFALSGPSSQGLGSYFSDIPDAVPNEPGPGGGGVTSSGNEDFIQNVKAPSPSVNVQPYAGVDPGAGSEKLYGDFFSGEKADIGNVSLVEPGKPLFGASDIGGAAVAKMFGLDRLVAQGGLPGFGTEEGGPDIQGTPPSPVTIQGFNRPDLLETPANFGFTGLDEVQQLSRIATEGLHGNSMFRGEEAQNVFKNLLQRSLIGEGGKLGDINSMLPVVSDYITQVLGLDISNLESLLGALR